MSLWNCSKKRKDLWWEWGRGMRWRIKNFSFFIAQIMSLSVSCKLPSPHLLGNDQRKKYGDVSPFQKHKPNPCFNHPSSGQCLPLDCCTSARRGQGLWQPVYQEQVFRSAGKFNNLFFFKKYQAWFLSPTSVCFLPRLETDLHWQRLTACMTRTRRTRTEESCCPPAPSPSCLASTTGGTPRSQRGGRFTIRSSCILYQETSQGQQGYCPQKLHCLCQWHCPSKTW